MTTLQHPETIGNAPFFGGLVAQPADPLLSIIAAFQADPRRNKIDLGVGVYRDNRGKTPVLGAVKEAEARLVASQPTKAYIGVEGNGAYLASLKSLLFQRGAAEDLVAMQTPGGTGAIRLAAEKYSNWFIFPAILYSRFSHPHQCRCKTSAGIWYAAGSSRFFQ